MGGGEKMRETNLESTGPFQRYESSVAEALVSPGWSS